MTDREFLQNLKSMIDAQLQNNSIPVPIEPNPVVITIPPATPTFKPTGNPFLDAYAQSNTPAPGGPPPANVPQTGNSFYDADYDIRSLNTPRIFKNDLNSHFITPDRDGTLILHIGKMPGNAADKVSLYVWGGGQSESLEIPTTDQVIRVKFTAKAGVRYGISISSTETFVLEARAELA